MDYRNMSDVDIHYFDHFNEQALRKSLDSLHQQGAVIGYYQLQGLLFAIACSPEKILPSEWFDLIWLNDEPQFDNEEDAREFYKAVVALSAHVNKMVAYHCNIPFDKDYSDTWQQELSEWCDGMLMGHQYLEELWSVAISDLNDVHLTEEIEMSLSLLYTFADPIRAVQMSLEQGEVLRDEHWPEAYTLFRKVLETYSSVGRIWSQASNEHSAEPFFESHQSPSPNKVCPCGSGLVFAKCCLH